MAVNMEAELIHCDHVLVKTRIFTKKCQECNKRKWPWSKAVRCIKCVKVWHRRCQPALVKPSCAVPEQSEAKDGEQTTPPAIVEPLLAKTTSPFAEESSLEVKPLILPVPSSAADGEPTLFVDIWVEETVPKYAPTATTVYGCFAYRPPRQRACHVVVGRAMDLSIGSDLLRAVPVARWLRVSLPVELHGLENRGGRATVQVIESGLQWPSIALHPLGSAESVYAAHPQLPSSEAMPTRVAELLAIAAPPALLAIAAPPAAVTDAAELPATEKKGRCTRLLCRNRRCVQRRAKEAAAAKAAESNV